MKVFGLTGGIGCGKSTVSKHWASQGLAVIDADLLSRQVVNPHNPENGATLYALRSLFGDGVFLPDGNIDRKKLGRIVFNDKEALHVLEGILHPRMEKLFEEELRRWRILGRTLVCYDSAILIEKHDYPRHFSQYRPIVVVHTYMNVQIERLCKRHPDEPKLELLARVLCQMPGQRKVRLADYVIDNNGSVEDTLKQADEVLVSITESL
jgi:dephospho-CoA kinase